MASEITLVWKHAWKRMLVSRRVLVTLLSLRSLDWHFMRPFASLGVLKRSWGSVGGGQKNIVGAVWVRVKGAYRHCRLWFDVRENERTIYKCSSLPKNPSWPFLYVLFSTPNWQIFNSSSILCAAGIPSDIAESRVLLNTTAGTTRSVCKLSTCVITDSVCYRRHHGLCYFEAIPGLGIN